MNNKEIEPNIIIHVITEDDGTDQTTCACGEEKNAWKPTCYKCYVKYYKETNNGGNND